MVITNKLKFDSPALTMGGVCVGLSRAIKILGLTVDDKLTFNEHVANVCRKALNLYKQLARAAKIHWGLNSEVIRTIYNAVVEPVIMYAASAWAPAARKKCVRRQLDTVQRGFVQKIVKAYRTVSLNSALILAGLLPLDLRIQEAADLYEIKRGLSQRVIGNREVEKPVCFLDMPHPAHGGELSFAHLPGDGEPDQPDGRSLHIYTDGSKIEGKVGAALSVWINNTETESHQLSLDSVCSVYQAELLALERATALAAESAAQECSIFCDSRSALETVVNNVSLHPIAFKVRQNLTTPNIPPKKLNLFWVKAHNGVEGNERADSLAKDAALRPQGEVSYDRCPVSYAKRQLRLNTLDEWNRRYQSGTTAGITRMFLPCALEAYRIVRKLRPFGIQTQVLTGHGGLSEYLHRFKCKESPSCTCDPDVPESVPHILFECPVFGREREDLQQKLGVNVGESTVAEIMGGRKREQFMLFAEGVMETVFKRNSSNAE
ncbi:uncharacterized protein [Epargyreus clarus]|uniref:uncharacterized protein n=2 Tax=Epargyreus clarus TaxID=520877 RepID=UPI003C2E3FAA